MTEDQATDLSHRHESRCPSVAERAGWGVERWELPGKWMLRATGSDGRRWVIKFAVDHGGRAPETCKREVLISLLGQAVGVPVVDAWTIPSGGLLGLVEPLHPDLIRDHAVLMPLLAGEEVQKARGAAMRVVSAAPGAVADLLAFMHWVGDDDRSLVDVMLVGGRLTLIDNGLCGPGRDVRIRSYHPMPDTDPTRIALKCYGGGKHALVEFVLRDAAVTTHRLTEPTAIGRIEALSHEAIERLVEAASLERRVADALNDRKRLLRSEFPDWLASAAAVCGA